jgi:DTW domain-containing protein
MHRALCICALVPRLETRTRLVLVLHKEEERKPTNTGLLAARALVRSDVLVVGDRARPAKAPTFQEGEEPLLLFPGEGSRPIEDFAPETQGGRPLALVVPDGTWRQARRAAVRFPGLAAATRVSLPPGPPSRYQLRRETREGGLATLEAIARAFAVLEGPERGPPIERALLGVFRVMVDRTLWLRGALRDDEVEGGIPEAARLDDPRGGRPPG